MIYFLQFLICACILVATILALVLVLIGEPVAGLMTLGLIACAAATMAILEK